MRPGRTAAKSPDPGRSGRTGSPPRRSSPPAAVSTIGLKRIAPASSSTSRNGLPGAWLWRMKSTSRIEFRTMIPASAMKPIIEVAVNGARKSMWPMTMPTRVSGIGVRITSGSLKTSELGDHQHIDAEQATPKAAPMSRNVTQVISHSPSHSTVGVAFVGRLAVQADVGFRRRPPQSSLVDRLVDGQHAVDRRFVAAGKFGGDHFGIAAVAAEHRRRPASSAALTTSPSWIRRGPAAALRRRPPASPPALWLQLRGRLRQARRRSAAASRPSPRWRIADRLAAHDSAPMRVDTPGVSDRP